MKITVFAKPRARIQEVIQNSDGSYTVRVREAPDEGKANTAIIRALAKHFCIAQSRIELISGHAGKKKVFSIL